MTTMNTAEQERVVRALVREYGYLGIVEQYAREEVRKGRWDDHPARGTGIGKLDDKDRTILARRTQARARLDGPQVGDFVLWPNGETRRFTERWPTGLQTTAANALGSFYLADSGHMSYSGGLDPIVPFESIHPAMDGPTRQLTSPGPCWFFHHDDHRAHNGVTVSIPVLVWRITS